MCQNLNFFPLFTFYFFLVVLFTLTRVFVTYKGIFFSFILFLAIFLAYLIYIFDFVILWGSTSEFYFSINCISWLGLDVAFSFRLDSLSYLFILLVVVIGLGTNFYVLNYLKYEANEDIFALLINWFMFSMIFLTLSNNLFSLFLGWESIGLSSFFLINFWNTRRGTIKSSFKAFFFNKISDVFLFLFLILINTATSLNDINTLNSSLFLQLFELTSTSELAAICLFCCTLFKSAQLFGHLWLPDSMEAPVPASALIHSATLVSAGVYLLLRFNSIISLFHLQVYCVWIGSITAAFGGIVSAAQTDMKKLLAYSTISHCGFLFVLISTQMYILVIIYLFLHGLFKASTFFCAGSFIRIAGSQDTRNMGALNRILPVDTLFLLICAFNLGGLPFSMGFLYKNVFLISLLNTYNQILIIGFAIISLLSSLVYTYRLVYYSAFDTAKEFFASFIYELQQKQVNVTQYWSLTSPVQIIAMLIILSFSGWIYIIFMNYFLYSGLVLEYSVFTLEFNVDLLRTTNILYKSFYEIFYSFYLLVITILCLVNYRSEYSFSFKLNFMLYTLTSFFFMILFSIFL